jgi:hypothetical protein
MWAGLAVAWVLPSVGCQVEYAGMTLPSGKYLRDDVQYFAPGTHFPWANTQAATQRARMQAMGLDVPSSLPSGPADVRTGTGALPRVQNIPGAPTNINVERRPAQFEVEGVEPAPEAPGPVPPGAVPPPPDAAPPVPQPGNVEGAEAPGP